MKELKISFPETESTVYALPGTSLFECITRAGILIRTPCGGAGICGKCAVKVVSGKIKASSSCRKFFSDQEIAEGFRLACRTVVEEDTAISIPAETLIENGVIALTTEDENMGTDSSPGQTALREGMESRLVTRQQLPLVTPTMEEPVSDLDNLRDALGNIDIDIEILRKIPELLREHNFSISAVTSEQRLIAAEPPDLTANFAVAIDIGTTTIAGALIDLTSGRQISGSGMLNPQTKFGDDVLSRICVQSESDAGVQMMRDCIIDGCNELIGKLCADKNIQRDNIYSVSIAGNTVMQTMFCGVTTRFLGQIPFIAPFAGSVRFPASELGLQVNPKAEIVVFPVLGGFVGGDITAGLIAIGFNSREDDGNALFVDVGTNGEIVLKHQGKLFATAAAAGPAFEGAGIEHGMRAANGAIEKILIEDGQLLYNVIGNETPKGICGTALIDIVAELLKCGIIDETGRILSPDECRASVAGHFQNPENLICRLTPVDSDGDTFNFLISDNSGNQGKSIYLTQKDVRSLQLASGAIRAAISILLKNANITEKDLDTIYIAGGFGNYIRRSHAIRIGLIPELPGHKVHFIGNTSLIGAKMVLCQRQKLLEAESLIEKVDVVDVSLDPEFQMEFANAMIFPS